MYQSDDVKNDGFTVQLINNGTEYSITNFDKARNGDITIPSEIGGKRVSNIGDYTFIGCK